MAFQLIRRILSINNYSGDLKPTLIAEYVCDTQSDLPVRSQANYYVGIGSEATVIADSSKWQMKSDGTWVMYESGTASYTKAEVDALLNAKADTATTLSGYGITDAYTKTQTDNLLSTKITISDTFGPGTNIAGTSDNHYDLDNLKQAGIFNIATAGATAYIDNKPNDTDITTVRAIVIVYTFTGNRYMQIYIPNRTSDSQPFADFYIRVYGTTWSSWRAHYGMQL